MNQTPNPFGFQTGGFKPNLKPFQVSNGGVKPNPKPFRVSERAVYTKLETLWGFEFKRRG